MTKIGEKYKEAMQEKEANYFAMCLLLPATAFKAAYNKAIQKKGVNHDPIKELAKLFGVEEYLIGQRIQSLKK